MSNCTSAESADRAPAQPYRARGPQDNLDNPNAFVELPTPRLAVGTVIASPLAGEEGRWYRQQILRALLRDTRKSVDSLRRQGFIQGTPGSPLPDFNKDQIRQKVHMIDHADMVQVAGHEPCYSQVNIGVANQCYLQRGQSHGGVSFRVHLLFRHTDAEGRKLAFIPPLAVATEDHLTVRAQAAQAVALALGAPPADTEASAA